VDYKTLSAAEVIGCCCEAGWLMRVKNKRWITG